MDTSASENRRFSLEDGERKVRNRIVALLFLAPCVASLLIWIFQPEPLWHSIARFAWLESTLGFVLILGLIVYAMSVVWWYLRDGPMDRREPSPEAPKRWSEFGVTIVLLFAAAWTYSWTRANLDGTAQRAVEVSIPVALPILARSITKRIFCKVPAEAE